MNYNTNKDLEKIAARYEVSYPSVLVKYLHYHQLEMEIPGKTHEEVHESAMERTINEYQEK